MADEEFEIPSDDGAPFGVKVLVCFLFADGVRRVVELFHGPETPGGPMAVFVLWALIDLLLALLLLLRTRAGRYWTQAILAVHVFYLTYTLGHERPYLWLTMGATTRARMALTLFLDGLFVAYLASQQARAYLDEGP